MSNQERLQKEHFYKVNSEKVIEALEKRNMKGIYVATKEEALKSVMELIPEGSTIGNGGSVTLNEVGVLDEIRKGNYEFYDRAEAKNPEEMGVILHQSLNADYYVMSTNAITQDGELVNMDGSGNRVAALIYGPKHVIIVAGVNKVVKTIEEARLRTRNVAAPINNMRLNTENACTVSGQCHNCKVPKTICCQEVITRYSKIKDRITVIFVGEELGY